MSALPDGHHVEGDDMNIHLNHVQDWRELARQSRYKAGSLAELLHISPWTLQRCIRRLFERSPQDWLNEQRLVLAAEMLPDCDSLKGLAYELGYKNESHFCHQFKRHYGRSPKDFLRQKNRQARGGQRQLSHASGHSTA